MADFEIDAIEGEKEFGFEHLSGLFASTPVQHRIIAMTIRQTAYLYRLVKSENCRKVIEIGRYKGGSTLTIAMGLKNKGTFWSIDIGEKEDRLGQRTDRTYDRQLQEKLDYYGLTANLIVGDSRTFELNTEGEVDLVFIDGDHSYEGVKNDFERFGRKVKVGGDVLFDDACDAPLYRSHVESVGRLISEVVDEGKFRIVAKVDSMIHLRRTA
jgi:predicted O-methyltransferase YrrM